MARPLTVTKERILSAALNLVRSGGPSALTARRLCEALGCGANAIFSSFGSIQGVRDAVKKEARALYRRRVSAGFSLHPPFKGFGMALLWFAMDEPQLYSLVMDADMPTESFEDYADEYVGFKQESLAAIAASFSLRGHDAEMLYYQMVLVVLGLAQASTRGGCPLSIPQVSGILGKNVRAFLMVIRAGADERERFVPQADTGPGGDVDSYVLMQTLAGQNHLLEQLHATPRYIQDGEWAELERVLRNSFDLTPESLQVEVILECHKQLIFPKLIVFGHIAKYAHFWEGVLPPAFPGFRIMKMTAATQMAMPTAIRKVKGSPNSRVPMRMAVNYYEARRKELGING